MSMVGFLLPLLDVPRGIFIPTSSSHFLLSPWSPALVAELPNSIPGTQRASVCWAVSAQGGSSWPCGVSSALSSGMLGMRPLATGHFISLTAMPKILINVLGCNDEGQHSHVAHSPLLSAAGPQVLLHHHSFHAPHYVRGKFSYLINGTEESRKYMGMDEDIH